MTLPRKRAVILLIVALVLAVGGFTGFRLLELANSVNGHAGLGDVIGLAQNQDDTPGTLAYKIHHGERVNILMLGYGGGTHDGAYLSDSMMMISVQGTDRAALTSIPRDTYVKIKATFADRSAYEGKINAAYAIPLSKNALGKPAAEYDTAFEGAGKLASKVVGEYLGVNIDYWVGVDFTAFRKVVDAVGGVDVNVPSTLDDPEYPDDNESGYMHIHFDPGVQHMDGKRALIYVRERHADNDFGRSRRQQQVIALVKEKVQKPSVITRLYGLMDALKDNVHTNMSLNDLKVFGSIAGKINGAGVHHVSIDATNWQWETYGYYDGAYLLYARDATMASLHKYIAAEMVDPAVLAEDARVQFSSSPAESSRGDNLAGIFSSTMHMLNFNTGSPATTRLAPPTTVVHDYSGGRATKTAEWMATYFGGSVVTEDPATAPSAPDAYGATPEATPAPTPGPAAIVVALGRDVATEFDATAPVSAETGSGTYYQPLPTYRPYVAPTARAAQVPSPQPSAQQPAPSPSPIVPKRLPCTVGCTPTPAPTH
ncbi:MAG: LCP family protein [Candidatus Dormibacteria bacterium]